MHRRDEIQISLCGFFFVLRSNGLTQTFAWTYTTDLTTKGETEFQQWVTTRWQKERGNYEVVDFRDELEYGVTENFQLALYLNHR
ncbi:MAG TPA: hypothetical protein VIU10_00705 [Candidatus Udaeobacter sp.]|jgi:hypothetical protein